ncbi:MAG: alkaline phosphatase family protein [Acidobacteria bacterium]|nr:alkaline phosphatase family protein [Acidobacteriota bacterium]
MLKKLKTITLTSTIILIVMLVTSSLSIGQNILPPVTKSQKKTTPPNNLVSTTSSKSATPKLIVYLVIDQFRGEFLSRFDPWFGQNGFRALVKEGAYFTNANYHHGATYTGPGHTAIASGAYGMQHSIISNKWYNRKTNRSEAMLFDPNSKYIGIDQEVDAGEENSPANFIGTTIGDQLLLSNNFQSKVVTLAIKERAAIALGGKLGKAYWFNETTGGFLSSTYYMKSLPAWVESFNNKRIADSYFGKSWEKLPDEKLFQLCREDDYRFETNVKGNKKSFPHLVTGKLDKPGADFYEAFEHTPWANDLTFEFARAAIEAEQLGMDDKPDFLAISLTANDLVGHAYGPYSQEVADITIRTDKQIGDFLSYLDKKFGKDNILVVLTADHGAGAVPEYSSDLGLNGMRIKKKFIKETIENALNSKYGKAAWVAALEDPNVYLNYKAIEEKKLSHEEVEHAVGEALLSIEGVAGYLTRTQFLNGTLPKTTIAQAYQYSFHPERGGDIVIVLKPFYIWGKYAEKDEGATHGSPYWYDRHVPLIIRSSSVKAGVYNKDTQIISIAPTVATILRINPPAISQGEVLAEILK